jgi:L-lactate dehydrogenase
VLPVSTLQQALYGVRDVCLSVPTVVGCGGARQQVELPLTQKERLGLQQSARVLRETIDQVEARVGKVRAGAAQAPAPRGNAAPAGNGGRAIPRSAWQTAK